MKKMTLLFWVLAVSVILTVFVHFSPNTGTTDKITSTRYQPNEVASPNLPLKESTGNTTNTRTFFNVTERDDEIQVEQPENTPCPDAVHSTESIWQISNLPSNENVPLPTPLPDGRIFTRGEPPYGYLPTCSPKDKDMPFVPVEPD